jgi:hypothetical protein
MDQLPLFAEGFLQRLWQANMWYAVPLIIAVSLVYAATRHEDMREILPHALRFGLWTVAGMVVLFGVLWFLSWRL